MTRLLLLAGVAAALLRIVAAAAHRRVAPLAPVLLMGGVAGAHTAYYLSPDLDARPWLAYIGTHILLVVVLLALLPTASRWPMQPVGPVACWWGAVESAQCVGCAWLTWGTASAEDLCVQRFGSTFYVVGAALSLAWLIASKRWGRRDG